MFTQSHLKELLHYDPETGVFTWAVSRSGVRIGDVAGCLKRNGYRYIGVDGRDYLAHRLAWLYMTGLWPADQIDHINGVKDDNRLVNLREATHLQNHQNRALDVKNTSGFLGVSWHRVTEKWRAYISVGGQQKHLGLFTRPEDAYAAHLTAKAELHTFNPEVRS